MRLGLNRLDPNSSTWHAVATWAEGEIAKARSRNDNIHNTPDETAALRGEIRAFKRLLALTKPNPALQQQQVDPDE
jgi:hypothetical protein